MRGMARKALVSGSSPNLAVLEHLVRLAVSGGPGQLAPPPVGEERRFEPRLGQTLLRPRGATSSPAQLPRLLTKVVDVACLGGTLTSVRITSVGQVLAPWLAAKRIARSTPPALLSPGSKEAAGIVRSIVHLEHGQENPPKGRTLTFAHQEAQYKTRQVHQLGQVDHLQVNHLQVDLHQEHRHKVLPRPTTK